MQAYSQEFAEVYNRRWSGFASQVAPHILDYYESVAQDPADKTLLDLCCGAGHLARHFLNSGYRVTGIDLSADMIRYADENAGEHLKSGSATFRQADVSNFSLDNRFGLVVSTYDSLNHLENEQALFNCFRCAHAVANDCFIFDLNTKMGLQRWNSVQVADHADDGLIVTRGLFDGHGPRACTRITGFIATPDGTYRRFDETVYNTVFAMERVRESLLKSGWAEVHFARFNDLATPIADPEKESRVFIVARKQVRSRGTGARPSFSHR